MYPKRITVPISLSAKTERSNALSLSIATSTASVLCTQGGKPSGIGFSHWLSIFLIFLILIFRISEGVAVAQADGASVLYSPNFVTVIVREGDTFSSLAEKYLKDPRLDWVISEYNETDSLKPGQFLIIPLTPQRKGGLTLVGYQTVPVLSYHNFSPPETNRLTVSQRAFGQQMEFLREKGYRVIPMDQFFDFLEWKAAIPPKSVVLTIDDGWRSAYEIAFPILEQYGYPASLFIYTDMIASGKQALSWNLLKEMAAYGITAECHTRSHRNLTLPGKRESFKEYFERLEKELTDSREIIRNKLGREAKYLAYPFGDTNHLVIALAKKLGFRGAFTIHRGSNPFFIHNYRVNRSMIYGSFSLTQFERNLESVQSEDLR